MTCRDLWQRNRVYEQVLREGTADDVRHFIDVDLLLDLWDELILPPAVSRVDRLARRAPTPRQGTERTRQPVEYRGCRRSNRRSTRRC